MLSASFAEPVGLWIASRMPLRLFGVAALLVVGAAALGGTPSTAWALAATATALAMLFQFRLWDDLADAALDRLAHPERFLPRCASSAPFRAAVAMTAVLNVIAIFLMSGPIAAVGLVSLNLALAAWYLREPAVRTGIAGTLALLLKYPVFVLLLTPAPHDPLRLALGCAAVYVAVCIHEWRTS